ncbi:YcbX family protein [Orbus sturtevantii]|uniref:YcbX family protein n=1 Tax=Orbus sturtevantii TaxID=3074109 RepID=UPI00370CFC59
MIFVNQLYIHPVKSMQSIALKESDVLLAGLKYDRIFMVSEPDGSFVTAREAPQLLQLNVTINNDGILISDNQKKKVQVNYADFSATSEPTEVWGCHFTAYIASINVNRFLSEFLQKDVQLRWIGKQSDRTVKRYPNTPLAFADGYPFLLINQASFNYLQQQCPQKLAIEQFRGNIIIDGALPFAEDGWKTIKIGDIIFDLVKPCARCVMTRVDLSNHQFFADNEPLKTLRYFRLDEQGEIDFGINMIARNSGKVSINDPVEVLQRQTAKNYIKSFPLDDISQAKPCIIIVESTSFVGNNQQPLLEQLEQNGINLPYSCRTGVCGRCQMILTEGDVTPMTQSAIRRNNRILACSCIPKTKQIKLKFVRKA